MNARHLNAQDASERREAAFQAEQNIIRRMWGVEAYKRFKVPKWLKRQVRRVHPELSANESIREFLPWSFVDHWGELPNRTFVCEPYFDIHHPVLLEDALKCAKKYGLDVRWSASSWHYPGYTVRFTFDHPSRTEAE